MKLTKEDKVQFVSEVSQLAKDSCSVILSDYRNIPVDKMTQLRKKTREEDVVLKVVRNTLLKIALKGTDFEKLGEDCLGPSIVAFSLSDPGAGARILKEFSKENETFAIKSFGVDGKVFRASDIDKLASLPNREEAITKVAILIQMPVTKFVRTLNDVPTKLVRVLSVLKEQKEVA